MMYRVSLTPRIVARLTSKYKHNQHFYAINNKQPKDPHSIQKKSNGNKEDAHTRQQDQSNSATSYPYPQPNQTNPTGPTQIQQSNEPISTHQVTVPRNYNETSVPGLTQSRKYTNLSALQQQIIQTNKFDLMNHSITPKVGSTNSYAGIAQSLTEVSLGAVKIKGKHEVFLSEIDPQNVPADLDIRFDEQKQLKIVGKQSSKQNQYRVKAKQSEVEQKQHQQSQKDNKFDMLIKPQTLEQKTIKQHMKQQFSGFGFQGYKYNNVKSIRRWDLFLTIVLFSLLIPFTSTLQQLRQCYSSTHKIEGQRMKQVKQLKQRSYQQVLLTNSDFNKSLL